ncbi:MAG: GNAT family N-acetyltransferase [Amylibacter sp.]
MSWKPPSAHRLYDVIDQSWPPAEMYQVGPFTLRRGDEGGQRVSSASLRGENFTPDDIIAVERSMDNLAQPRLFMIRDTDQLLDATLADQGYRIKDPVSMFAVPSAKLAEYDPKGLAVIDAPEPLAVMSEIWEEREIGKGRRDVMRRAQGAKACFLGRIEDQPAGVTYVGCDDDIAMLHALEILPKMRRKGLAQKMLGATGAWAARNGADTFSMVVLTANDAACALYQKVGMIEVGNYHYRIKDTL